MGLMILKFCLSFVVKSSMDHIWLLIAAIQVIVYLPSFMIKMPANLVIFLDAMRKVAEFKVVDLQVL